MQVDMSWPDVQSFVDLSGKVAIVTGAGLGIGRSVALALASAGASLVLIDAQLAAAEATAQSIGQHDGKALAIESDVADPYAAESLLNTVVEQFGAIDVLVNNAGIYPPGLPIPELDVETFERTLKVNLHGSFHYISAAAKLMLAGSAIINISSNTSLRPAGPGIAHYCSSKAAVNALTRSAAVDLAAKGIRVNAVLPGIVATEGTSAMAANYDFFAERTPSGRIGKPEDIARAVLFLASESSSFINGQCLVVDGGASIVG